MIFVRVDLERNIKNVMEHRLNNPLERKSIDRVLVECDSKEKAIELVKEFWKAMPHGRDLIPESEEDSYWVQELTMGDRTMVRDGVLHQKKGKWIVLFLGNHNPLSPEAVAWLRIKKLITT